MLSFCVESLGACLVVWRYGVCQPPAIEIWMIYTHTLPRHGGDLIDCERERERATGARREVSKEKVFWLNCTWFVKTATPWVSSMIGTDRSVRPNWTKWKQMNEIRRIMIFAELWQNKHHDECAHRWIILPKLSAQNISFATIAIWINCQFPSSSIPIHIHLFVRHFERFVCETWCL